MLSKSKQKLIAKQIAALEKTRQYNLGKNPELVKSAEDELEAIPEKYGLGLVDLLEIDDMVQDILKK
jgi:hypothetical protein